MALPLRIFEERYRVMVAELLESGGVFGVVLIRDGGEVGGAAKPFEVGTTARIEECAETGGGRYALTARGGRRFRLVRMLEPRPYPYGDIEIIRDEPVAPSIQLQRAMETVRATFPAYFRLALALTDQWAQGMTLPTGAHELVNFLGPWVQAEEEAKQRLLEIEPAEERVAELAELIDDLLTRTREEVEEYRRRKFSGPSAEN